MTFVGGYMGKTVLWQFGFDLGFSRRHAYLVGRFGKHAYRMDCYI